MLCRHCALVRGFSANVIKLECLVACCAGNVRGELAIWDVGNHQHIKTWMAHKRSAITCVKFSHDATSVYSCGEDNKVGSEHTQWVHGGAC